MRILISCTKMRVYIHGALTLIVDRASEVNLLLTEYFRLLF